MFKINIPCLAMYWHDFPFFPVVSIDIKSCMTLERKQIKDKKEELGSVFMIPAGWVVLPKWEIRHAETMCFHGPKIPAAGMNFVM